MKNDIDKNKECCPICNDEPKYGCNVCNFYKRKIREAKTELIQEIRERAKKMKLDEIPGYPSEFNIGLDALDDILQSLESGHEKV